MQDATLPHCSAYQIVVDPNQTSSRLDKLLVHKLPAITRTQIQAAIKQGCVQVDQKPVKASYQVKPHQVISVQLPASHNPTTLLAEDIPLEIIYQDDALLIVNKPALMVVHPAHANWTGTLVNALVYHFKDLPTTSQNQVRPGLVHRIDKGTSGLLVIGKTAQSLAALAQQFFDHTIQRQYQGLVWGSPAQDQGTIHIPLKRSKADRRLMAPCKVSEGKDAITHYKVLQRLGYVSLLAFELETGRTHQIRAHMKHLGHPLFGDPYYGGDRILAGPGFSKYKTFVKNCWTLLPHQALHAKALGFVHPTTQKKMYFEAELPANFGQVIQKWTRYITSCAV